MVGIERHGNASIGRSSRQICKYHLRLLFRDESARRSLPSSKDSSQSSQGHWILTLVMPILYHKQSVTMMVKEKRPCNLRPAAIIYSPIISLPKI